MQWVVIFAAIALAGCHSRSAGGSGAPLEWVAHGTVAPGAEPVPVFSPIDGQVQELAVATQQTVRAGDTLAIVESPDGPPPSEVINAQADLVALEHDLRSARYGPGASDRAAAQRRLEEARRRVDRARKDEEAEPGTPSPGGLVVKAPFDAVVLERYVTVGQAVRGNFRPGATAMFQLVAIGPVWIDADLAPTARVTAGSKALVRPNGAVVLEGTVDRIEVRNGSPRIRVIVANPRGELTPGMLVTLTTPR
jgi:cobalt-zinc-cadmium efflux system membrane fusion protein